MAWELLAERPRSEDGNAQLDLDQVGTAVLQAGLLPEARTARPRGQLDTAGSAGRCKTTLPQEQMPAHSCPWKDSRLCAAEAPVGCSPDFAGCTPWRASPQAFDRSIEQQWTA